MLSSFTALLAAYRKAREGHLGRSPVLRFSFYLERELVLLENEITRRAYRPRKKKEFFVHEPKQRKIYESHFRDRVVHHALCAVLNPRFEKRSLPVSYACRKGFGNLRALDKLRRRLMDMEEAGMAPWILKIDIRKYFDSVPHDHLVRLIARDAPTEISLWLADLIVRSHHSSPGRGLPIGNLTSQIFANLYLNELDHFIVHRRGFKHCFRFMDDIVILHDNQDDLNRLLSEIQHFCQETLSIQVHPQKIFLRPARKGVEFLGFAVTNRKRTVKPSNMARIKRRLHRLDRKLRAGKESLARIERRLKSWRAYARHGQVRYQLDHLAGWSERLSPEMSRTCLAVFSPPSEAPSPESAPTQPDGKTAHSVSYQSPSDHEIVESGCEFFLALRSPRPAMIDDDLPTPPLPLHLPKRRSKKSKSASRP